MTNGGTVDGPWISCPWCTGTVPLTHFAESDEEPGAQEAVCDACGRRVSFLPPVPPDEPGDAASSAAA
ncbi:hypothetical protein [Pseudofrankia sp. DC12]|uniref:hypothetical protein n=1 Tax=Pseudofrankia sp. DC12 TaxID=683315 RepID=UPI0005F81491|nr:hypothetical protein [Pseudofrankia sp. DC12]